MNQSSENWKVGLFVVGVLTAGVLGLAALGAHGLSRPTRDLVAYFDESIDGLGVGTPVKFRGVSVGTVKDITFAPDRRHVQVAIAAYEDGLRGLGLQADASTVDASLQIEQAGIRLRIVRSALTGFTFLEFDVFDEATRPVQTLPFPKPFNYVPTERSKLKSLEDDLAGTLEEMPRLLRRATVLMGEIAGSLDDLRLAETSGNLNGLIVQARAVVSAVDIENVNGLVSDLRRAASALDLESLARATSQVDEVVASAGRVTAQLEAQAEELGATLSATRGAAESVRDELTAADLGSTARSLRTSAAALEQLALDAGRASELAAPTLRELERTLAAVAALAERLERDPSSILFGTRRDE